MITFHDLKRGIIARLTAAVPDAKCYFDNVDHAQPPFFYVEFLLSTNTIDETYSDRTITVDISFVAKSNAEGRVDRNILFDVADKLDKQIRPVLHIAERYLFVPEARINFTDEVLHYSFDLKFTDAYESTEVKNLMQKLEISLYKKE